jgi:dTDP-4-dehydrorhamnose reductase
VRFLVVGATGQLGQALVPRLGDDVVWSGGSTELDIRDADAVARVVHGARPDVVINAAAYNNVDRAETDVLEAFAVNAAGPLHLARAASAVEALIVHISTDYVFDGRQPEPYTEDDCPRPLGVYGASKLAGESLVIASGCPSLVVRTSGMFGAGGSKAKGGCFVDRILERARAGEGLRVVSDQVFSPTYAPDLAVAVIALIGHGARGLFHVTNAGSCSWHGLAAATLELSGLDKPVEEIRARNLIAPARRPPHSILSKARYDELGLPVLRAWSAALEEYLRV